MISRMVNREIHIILLLEIEIESKETGYRKLVTEDV